MELTEGTLVRHPKKPEWGLGKVLTRKGNSATIFFKNDPTDHRTILLDMVSLQVADEQSDEMLDRLPPFVDGAFVTKAKKVTIEDGIQRFKELFPLGFEDPGYLEAGNDQAGGERGYKLRAHERWIEEFGNGKGEELLASGNLDELRQSVQSVVTKDHMNLLSPYEAMALRDGLAASDSAARAFLDSLLSFVSGGPNQALFNDLAKAVGDLPVEEGRARVATWPVQTLLPYLADPTRFMFLKPEPTRACADRLRFDLLYDSALRWTTYERLMVMGTLLLKELRPLGARDFIDVQSFMWVIQKY
jgi:hypothetical protein